MHQNALKLRIIGLIGSLLLTLTAFGIIFSPDFFHLQVKTAIFVICILALLQFIIQFVFFLDLWREKGPKWNLFVFFSTLSVILIIILGSIWIMDHLDYHMMM